MQKKKSGVKKCLEICAIMGAGGVGRLMANTILNFHFDFLNTYLSTRWKLYIYRVNCKETVEEQVENQRMGLAIGMEKEGE